MATKEIPSEVQAPRTNHFEHMAQHEKELYHVVDNVAGDKNAPSSAAAGGVEEDDFEFTFNKFMAMLVSLFLSCPVYRGAPHAT